MSTETIRQGNSIVEIFNSMVMPDVTDRAYDALAIQLAALVKTDDSALLNTSAVIMTQTENLKQEVTNLQHWERIANAYDVYYKSLGDVEHKTQLHQTSIMVEDHTYDLKNPRKDYHEFTVIAPNGAKQTRSVIEYENGKIAYEYGPNSKGNTHRLFASDSFTLDAIEREFLKDILKKKPLEVKSWKVASHISYSYEGKVEYLDVRFGMLPGYSESYKKIDNSERYQVTKRKIHLSDCPGEYNKVDTMASLSEIAKELKSTSQNIDIRGAFRNNFIKWCENDRCLMDASIMYLYLGPKEVNKMINELYNESVIAVPQEKVKSQIRVYVNSVDSIVTLDKLKGKEGNKSFCQDLPSVPLSTESKLTRG